MPMDQIPAWVNGVLTPVDKLVVHREGLRHKAVSVFVMAGEKVLLQRRAIGKYHSGGLWANSCCTHPQWNETPVACATRRLREELGIIGLYPVHAGKVEYRADVGNGMTEHEVVDIFLAEAPEDLPLFPDYAEVSETRWVGLYDLVAHVKRHPDWFTPWLRIYLHDHLDEIFPPHLRK